MCGLDVGKGGSMVGEGDAHHLFYDLDKRQDYGRDRTKNEKYVWVVVFAYVNNELGTARIIAEPGGWYLCRKTCMWSTSQLLSLLHPLHHDWSQ